MGSLFTHLRRALDAELAGIQIRASNAGFRIALLAAAGIVALLGLLTLELAAFLALATLMPPPWAALATAVLTFILAGVVALVAKGNWGEVRLQEVQLRRELARREAKQDLERLLSVASMTAATLGTLKKLRRPTPMPTAATIQQERIRQEQAQLPVAEQQSAIRSTVWKGSTRNGLIAGVAALGFLVGVSPAVRRSMKRFVS